MIYFHWLQAVIEEHISKPRLMFENYPTYLVPDTNCFVNHLEGVKAIVASQDFTLVVPLIGKWVEVLAQLLFLHPSIIFVTLRVLFFFFLFVKSSAVINELDGLKKDVLLDKCDDLQHAHYVMENARCVCIINKEALVACEGNEKIFSHFLSVHFMLSFPK